MFTFATIFEKNIVEKLCNRMVMKYLFEIKKYSIGTHNLQYHIANDFRDEFHNFDIYNANLDIIIIADVKQSYINFDFNIVGTVEVKCDFCLDNFDYKINTKNNLLVRFDDRSENSNLNSDDDNKISLPKSTDNIDLATHIFDYIILSLPIKKVHPLDDIGQSTCNPFFIKKMEEINNNKKSKDPRWDKLNNFLKP